MNALRRSSGSPAAGRSMLCETDIDATLQRRRGGEDGSPLTAVRTIVDVIARLSRGSLIAIMATGIAAGCGSTGGVKGAPVHHVSRPATRAAPQLPLEVIPEALAIPTPGPTRVAASPASVAVIRGWSDALRHGDVIAAAGYFALPSVMINGFDAAGDALVSPIRTRFQAEAANASLPCGAKFISADQRGQYVNALFLLTNRPGPGGGCGSGTGETARTNFVISDGRIAQWIRAPDDPGDNRRPAPPPPSTPANPQPPTPVA